MCVNSLTIDGGNLSINSGRLILGTYSNLDVREGGKLVINGGQLNIQNYYKECLVVDDLQINGGNTVLKNTYSNGIIAKTVSVNGGSLNCYSFGNVAILSQTGVTISPYSIIEAGSSPPANVVDSYNGEYYVNISGSNVPTGDVVYRTHVENLGWQDWKADGDMSGTTGQSLRLEAVQVRLTGINADKYDIYYQVHAQNYGWLGWAKNAESSGTAGQSLRLEGIKIMVIPKGAAGPISTVLPFYGN